MPKVTFEFETVEEVDEFMKKYSERNQKLDPPKRFFDVPTDLRKALESSCVMS